MSNDSWGHDFCPLFGGQRCWFAGGWECMECMLLSAGGTEFVLWWEVVRSSKCPLSEVPLYYIIAFHPNVSFIQRFHCKCLD